MGFLHSHFIIIFNSQEMTQLVNDYGPNSLKITDNVIQPSIVMPAERNDDDFYPSKRFWGSYFYFFYSPVYVYIVSTSTSYVYTTTKTFYISLCVPSLFSYPICWNKTKPNDKFNFSFCLLVSKLYNCVLLKA